MNNFTDLRIEVSEKAYAWAEKIQPAYELNQWTWYMDGGPRVPTVTDIEAHIMSLLHTACRWIESSGDFPNAASSGRIEVRVYNYHFATVSLLPESLVVSAEQHPDGLVHYAPNPRFTSCGRSIGMGTDNRRKTWDDVTCDSCILLRMT